MAALAYVVPPVTGLIAYFGGKTARERFHGLQAVALGLAWPAALFAASLVTPGVTQIVWAAGALLWVGLFTATLSGRDPRIPLLGRWLERAAHASPRG